MNTIKEMPVERDEYGCWTHPEYEKFCAGREYMSTEEFDAWMKENNLQWSRYCRLGTRATRGRRMVCWLYS